MINIASSQPVQWPVSSTAGTIAPVAAVSAVTPAQRSQREGQSGLGAEQHNASARDARQNKGAAPEKASKAAEAAPLLPRPQAKDGEEPTASQASTDNPVSAQEIKEAEDKRSEHMLKLMDVLSTVWKASAAVVDNALGRGDEALPGEKADQAPSATGAAAASAPGSGTAHEGRSAEAAVANEGAQAGSEPPVAYTEQGASEWSALELGRLVSKRA